MKISQIRIENFRSFKDETIDIGSYNCLVGCNGSGKSNVLAALNIFFRDNFHSSTNHTVLSEDDFNCRDTSQPIRITVTFKDLSPEAQTDFEHYYRGGELSIFAEAVFNPQSKTAEVQQYGKRKGILAFASCFAATTAKDAKAKYKILKDTTFTDLPNKTTQDDIEEALKEYEQTHDDLCELIPSSDHFYGFTSGAKKLEKHVLWVYVPAFKDIKLEETEAKNTALGKLLSLTVRATVNFEAQLATIKSEAATKYDTLLAGNQNALDGLSVSLQTKLQEWSHPGARLKLQWKNQEDALKIVNPIVESIAGEGVFNAQISRFGHGLQRSYLLALLQELASKSPIQSPTLILGCEEPELYQHPPQAKHLVSVLLKLAEGNSQIILSTHSPYFVSGKDFEDVRYVSCNRTNNSSKVHYYSPEKLQQKVSTARGEAPIAKQGAIAKIHQALQPHISEMFFAPFPVFLEGLEDVAYLTTYMHLMGLWDKFREYGCHFVPVNNKNNLFNPITIAQEFKIPFFVVFDADGNITNPSQKTQHSKDNLTILNLCGIASPNAFPATTFWANNLVMWHTTIGDVIESDFGATEFNAHKTQANATFSNAGNLSKNGLFVSELLTTLWDAGHQSANLKKVCEEIIRVASVPFTVV